MDGSLESLVHHMLVLRAVKNLVSTLQLGALQVKEMTCGARCYDVRRILVTVILVSPRLERNCLLTRDLHLWYQHGYVYG